MKTSSIAPRLAGGLCASVLALAALAGCDRRPAEVPTPAPGSPPITTPTPSTGDSGSTGSSSGTTGSSGSTVPMNPPASAASQ